MKNDFITAVNNHELSKVRMMLSNELLIDPRGDSFSEMLDYAKNNLPDLFEVDKPARLDIPSSKEEWTQELLSSVKMELNLNFSKEKLTLYLEIANWVFREKIAAYDEQVSDSNDDSQLSSVSKYDEFEAINWKNIAVVGLAILAIVVILIFAIASIKKNK